MTLKKVASTRGGEYAGPCPGCGGDDRFRVWPEQNRDEHQSGSYWCRHCGRGGDCIQFMRDFDGLSFQQACDRLGRPLSNTWNLAAPSAPGAKKKWDPKHHGSPEARWREKAKKFGVWCYEQIFEHKTVMAWLEARGIRENTVVRFNLGWNEGDLYRDREAWGLSVIKNQKTGRRRPLWLPRGLVIPWFTHERGKPALARLRIRRDGDLSFGPRYYVVPGSSMATFIVPPVLSSAGTAERCIYVIVESELDAVLLAQEAGDLVGVAAMGSSAAKPDQATAEILARSPHILVALDFDPAGGKAWTWWKQAFFEAVRWPPPRGKDPGEAYQAGVDVRRWVIAGLPAGYRIATGVQ